MEHYNHTCKLISDVNLEIFEHDKKVTLDDVKDWECSNADNARIAKIAKSNNLAYRKTVNNKMCHAWVAYMKKFQGTKCVVQSKMSGDNYIVDTLNVFCEDKTKNKRNVKKSSNKPSKPTSQHRNKNVKQQLRELQAQMAQVLERVDIEVANDEGKGEESEAEDKGEKEADESPQEQKE